MFAFFLTAPLASHQTDDLLVLSSPPSDSEDRPLSLNERRCRVPVQGGQVSEEAEEPSSENPMIPSRKSRGRPRSPALLPPVSQSVASWPIIPRRTSPICITKCALQTLPLPWQFSQRPPPQSHSHSLTGCTHGHPPHWFMHVRPSYSSLSVPALNP